MLNKIFNIFQIGNNAQINKTIEIYDAKINTSIKRIEKDFNDGNIQQAMDDLSLLLEENNSNQKIKYQLLVRKASFLFGLRRYDEAVNLVENIEKNYFPFLEVKFEEVKLIVLSLHKQEEQFFQLANKIISESSQNLKRINFELMYYLNSNDINRAKSTFDNLQEEEKGSKDLSLMGGHIYSNIDYEGANHYYQIALTHDISFLEKAIIYGFYGTNIINRFMCHQTLQNNYKELLIPCKETTLKILENENYFESSYILNLKNIYLFILMVLDDIGTYLEFFEREMNNDLIWNQHYFQYMHIKDLPIDHQKVQNKILTGISEFLLLNYLHFIDKNVHDAKQILIFLDRNLKFVYENKHVLLFYIQGKLFAEESPSSDVIQYLLDYKYNSLEHIISYIRLYINNHNKIEAEDITKLLELVYKEYTISSRIIEALHLLKDLGKRREYLELAISKQTQFSNVVSETLQICYEDKNLLLGDFEYFIQNINTEEIPIMGAIADIYANFNAYDKSFEKFYMIFEKGNQDKEVLFKIIEIAFRHYQKTNEILEEKKEREIYDVLIAKKNNLALRDLIFLFQYSLVVLKDTKKILPILNEHILNTDIESLDKDIKIDLSSLYTQTTIGMHSNYEQLFIYEDNICYVEDGKTYLKGYAVVKENKENFGFYVVDKNTFFTIKNNPQYKQESLFHRIVGPFAYRVDNPNMIPIQVSLDGENPFSELFAFIDEISQHEKSLFERYSQEEFYGLYPLAKHDYANYFTLIPYLLEHKNYSLNSLKPSFMIDKKKILTLSSIVFLNHLGYLNEVLKMENIVIQQTTINWLQQYIEDYTPINRPTKFSYMDEEKPKFIPYTEEDEKKAIKFKDELIELTKKLLLCEIVNDTNENLPIARAYKMLAGKIGELEYHALTCCINHNYQIISENNIFEMLFDTLGFNKPFISNSFALLANILKEEQIYVLQEKLFALNYKYISNCPNIERILTGLKYDRFRNILNEQLLLNFRIWYKYGCLDDLIKEYIHTYKVLYPKTILPERDIFSDNMEYLLKIINMEMVN